MTPLEAGDALIDDQVALGAMVVVEASMDDCPDRTLWTRTADRVWQCSCCGSRRATADLTEPTFVGAAFGGAS